MPSDIYSPIRNENVTHFLNFNSKIFKKFPYTTEENLSTAVENFIVSDRTTVVLLDESLGFLGNYSKIFLNGEVVYTLKTNLLPTEEILQKYSFIKPDLSSAIAGIIQEEPILYDWLTTQINRPTLDTRSNYWYVVTQKEFEGSSLTDDVIQKFMDEAYIEGIQYILRKNGKKFKKEYVEEITKKYYSFGKTVRWTVRTRNCSEFLCLTILPKKYLNSEEIVDYMKDPAAAIRDGISSGLSDPKSNIEDVSYVARFSFLNFIDFTRQIKEIYDYLKSYGELQNSDANEKVREYIVPLTIEDYKREIDLDISELANSFFKEDGNFLETIELLLIANGVDIDTKYSDNVAENNILFAFDKEYNIIYIDLVRNNKVVALLADCDIFENEFGNYGVKSKRCGHLLYTYVFKKIINLYQDIENQLGLEEFIRVFIIPPPKEIDLPKITFECAKENFKKLAEDIKIKGLSSASTILQVAEFNARLGYANAISDNRSISMPRDAAAILGTAGDAFSALGIDSGIATGLANEGYDFIGRDATKKTSIREIRKILRRTDFQKAIVAFFVCQLRKEPSEGATEFLNKIFNSKEKKQFQEWFKNVFCSQTLQNILKAFAAFKKPEFKPMDVNKAIRTALQKAIVQLIIEIYETSIKLVIAWLSECDALSDKSPFTADQQLGINAAIDDVLNNADSPENGALNDAYDTLGLPPAGSLEGGQRASEADKKAIKDLLADISCILKTREICQLMTEGGMSDEVYSIIKGLIDVRYPSISKALRTREDIANLFLKLGVVLNLTDVCSTIQFVDVGDNRCGDRGIEDTQREALASNGLSPKQIDDILKDERKRINDRLDDVLKAANGRPENLPLFCRDGVPGLINPAKVDQTYADMFNDVLDTSLDRVYEQFNGDAKSWAGNMIEESQEARVKEAQLMAALAALQDSTAANSLENDATRRQANIDMLVTAGYLEQEYVLDENGNPKTLPGSDIKIPAIDKEGNRKYKVVGKPPKDGTAPGTVSPIFSGTLANTGSADLPGRFTQASTIKNNKLILKVFADKQREEFRSMLQATLDQNFEIELKDITSTALGNLKAAAANDIAKIIADIIASIATGASEDDLELYFGFEKWRRKNGPGSDVEILSFLGRTAVEFIFLAVEMFDIFIAQVANEPRGQLQYAELLSGVEITTNGVIRSPRASYPLTTNSFDPSPVRFSRESDNLDAVYSSTGAGVGVVDRSGVAAAISRQKAILATDNLEDSATAAEAVSASKAEIKILEADKALAEMLLNSSADEELLKEISGINQNIAANQEFVNRAGTAQENIDRLQNLNQMNMVSSGIFQGVDASIADFSDKIKDFENSVVLGAFIRLCKNAAKTLTDINERTKALFESRENAIRELRTIDQAFPNYRINYEYGNIPSTGSLDGGEYRLNIERIFVRQSGTITTESSSSLFNIVQKEPLDPVAQSYAETNSLFRGFDGSSMSAQQYVFENYLQTKGIQEKNAYKTVEKQYFEKIYTEASSSFFYGADENKLNNIRYLEILEQEDSIEKACGIRNSPLDLDEIKDQVKKDFKEDSCNYEPPKPDGTKRDKMNPVEQNISIGLLLATLRVYIYDYYLKGIFLFDKYNIGLTADTVMIDFLANSFEAEMRNIDTQYADRFLLECERYYTYKNKEKSAELSKTISNPIILKKIKFKELIKEQILYVSNRLEKKIKNTIRNVKKNPNTDFESTNLYYPKIGRIFNFFENNTTKDFALKVIENNGIVEVYYKENATPLFTAPKLGIKDNPEYRLLFEYCFPIRKYVSLVTIQAIIAANTRINSARAFTKTKMLLKTYHNQMMAASGYKDNRDSSDIPRPIIGSADVGSIGSLYLEIIIEFFKKTPLRILKGVCEIGDPNVFLASLPYNIAKPITLAISNELPFESKNKPLFNYTPVIGAGLIFCFIPPTPFGLAYYAFQLWKDEDWNPPQGKNSNDKNVDEARRRAGENPSCLAVRGRYLKNKPLISKDDLVVQYA